MRALTCFSLLIALVFSSTLDSQKSLGHTITDSKVETLGSYLEVEGVDQARSKNGEVLGDFIDVPGSETVELLPAEIKPVELETVGSSSVRLIEADNITDLVTKHQAKFDAVFRDSINVTEAVLIYGEEAKRLGLTPAEYIESCLDQHVEAARLLNVDFTDEEQCTLEKEAASGMGMKTIRIDNKDEVFKVFEKHFPKIQGEFMKRFVVVKEWVEKLDEGAQKFVHNIGNTILEKIVNISQKADYPLRDPLRHRGDLAKDIAKIIADYEALPQPSKDSFDKVICHKAYLRSSSSDFKMGVAMMALAIGFELEPPTEATIDI